MDASEMGKKGGAVKNPRKGFGSAEVLRKALATRKRKADERRAQQNADRIAAGIILPHEYQAMKNEQQRGQQ